MTGRQSTWFLLMDFFSYFLEEANTQDVNPSPPHHGPIFPNQNDRSHRKCLQPASNNGTTTSPTTTKSTTTTTTTTTTKSTFDDALYRAAPSSPSSSSFSRPAAAKSSQSRAVSRGTEFSKGYNWMKNLICIKLSSFSLFFFVLLIFDGLLDDFH